MTNLNTLTVAEREMEILVKESALNQRTLNFLNQPANFRLKQYTGISLMKTMEYFDALSPGRYEVTVDVSPDEMVVISVGIPINPQRASTAIAIIEKYVRPRINEKAQELFGVDRAPQGAYVKFKANSLEHMLNPK